MAISAPLAYVGFCHMHQAMLPLDKPPFVYWSGLDPHNEVFVVWESTRETDSFIRYGTDPEHLTWTMQDEVPVTLHRIHLQNLSPDTRYYYQAGPLSATSADELSEVRSFKTAPATPEEFNITCVSDTQQLGGMGFYNTLASAINKLPDTAFVLNVGDLTQTADDQNLWNLFFRESTFLDRFPLVPCPGNHDDIDKTGSKYIKYFGVTENNRDVCYAFDWGNARFIVAQIANRSHVDPEKPRNQAPFQWLEKTLAESQDRDYRILIYHIHRTDVIAPLVEKYNVSLAIHGHRHSYRRYTINQHMYICLGNGASLQEGIIREEPGTLKRTNNAGFTRLTINPAGIRVQTFTPCMDTMDEVFLRRTLDSDTLIPEEAS